MTKRVRKQIYKLEHSDLDRFPAWEFALDEEGRAGQDEATVRPVEIRRGKETAGGPIVVLAVFEFPNGRVRFGQLTIGAGSGIESAQPSLFLERRQLDFYFGAYPPPKREMKGYLRKLRTVSKVPFPIHVHTSLRDKRGKPLYNCVLKGLYRFGGFDKPARQIRVA